MAAPTPTFATLSASLRAGNIPAVTIVHGKEGYYADRLVEEFTRLVDEADRDFNLTVLYGSQALDPRQVVEAARRFPMMADRQVVILKEAHQMRADMLDKLAPYVEAPSEHTALLIVFRGAEPKGKELMAAARKHAVVIEAKGLTDRTVGPAIEEIARGKGMKIEGKALAMLRDYLGTDLAKINSELAKLAMILPKGSVITPEAIERHIGVSKDYNNFELVDALSQRNYAKAMAIVAYFKANPKANPTVLTVAALFNMFSTLMVMQFAKDRSPEGLCKAMGLRQTWQLRNYEGAARNYTARQTIEIVTALRRFDASAKGVGSRMNEYDLLRDLVYRIFTAKGEI